MISFVNGRLIEKNTSSVVIEAYGIGYEIEISLNTFYQLPEISQPIKLLTHFIVREDAQLLVGFYHFKERELFRQLIKVNNVGSRLALSILSSISPEDFAREISLGNSERLVKIPGVGKKTAERLLIEMRDKVKNILLDSSVAEENPSLSTEAFLLKTNSNKIIEKEALQALLALGYKPQQASRALANLDLANSTIEEVIKSALRNLVVI